MARFEPRSIGIDNSTCCATTTDPSLNDFKTFLYHSFNYEKYQWLKKYFVLKVLYLITPFTLRQVIPMFVASKQYG